MVKVFVWAAKPTKFNMFQTVVTTYYDVTSRSKLIMTYIYIRNFLMYTGNY